MKRILVAYSTTDGHTRRICERVRGVLEDGGHRVTVLPVGVDLDSQLAGFETVVLGASIRYGRHRPAVHAFVRRNAEILNHKASAFFSVNLTARKPEKRRPEANPYLGKFLRKINWQPALVAVFAGKLDYPKYGCLDRNIIRLIMSITGGPTDPQTVQEFTDWEQVKVFARRVADL